MTSSPSASDKHVSIVTPNEEDDDSYSSEVEIYDSDEDIDLRMIVCPSEDVKPCTTIPYFETTSLSHDLREHYTNIFRESEGGSAIYLFQEIIVDGKERIIILGNTAFYVCKPKEGVIRCVRYQSLTHIAQDSCYIGVTISDQHDFAALLPNNGEATILKTALQKLYFHVTGQNLRETAMEEITNNKPIGYAMRQEDLVAIPLREMPRRRESGLKSSSSTYSYRERAASVAGKRKSWKLSDEAISEQTKQYIEELEAQLANMEAQMARNHEEVSIEQGQLEIDLEAQVTATGEWQRRHTILKARERQLEIEQKRQSELCDSLKDENMTLQTEVTSLKQRLELSERESSIHVKHRDEIREILDVSDTGLMDALRSLLTTKQALEDDNFRLTKEVANLQKQLGSEPRLKKIQRIVEQKIDTTALEEARQLQTEAEVELTNARLQTHKAIQSHETTKLQLFEMQQKYQTLSSRHNDISQMQRNTVKTLEKKIGKLEASSDVKHPFISDFRVTAAHRSHSQGYQKSQEDPQLEIDMRVSTLLQGSLVSGTVRFVGRTDFAKGIWIGVALDDQIGKHNGTIGVKEYFKCASGHGLFLKEEALAIETARCVKCETRKGDHRPPTYTPLSNPSTVSRQDHFRELRKTDRRDEYIEIAIELKTRLAETQQKLETEESKVRFMQSALAKKEATSSPASERWGSRGKPPRFSSSPRTLLSPEAPLTPPTPQSYHPSTDD